MYRSPWELAALVRQRNAYLVQERQLCSEIAWAGAGLSSLMTQLRHRLGLGLIRVGQALAGYDGVRRLPTPSAHPATWGPRS